MGGTMHRIFAFYVILVGALVPLGAQASDADSILEAILSRHGKAALEASNVELAGTIAYPGEDPTPFTLTAQDRSARFVRVKGTETVTVVQNQGRSLSQDAPPGILPARIPPSSSAHNLVAILALIQLATNPRFEPSPVQGPEGEPGLQFREHPPPGEEDNPWLRPLFTVTFLLDASYRIQAILYEDDRGQYDPVTYLYHYDREVSGPFLQPSRVESFSGDYRRFEALGSSLRANVPVPSGFFDLGR